MAMDLSPDTLRVRFAELGQRRNEIVAASDPKRALRDRIMADAEREAAALSLQIARDEQGLFDLDQERALIARALGGRTGEQ